MGAFCCLDNIFSVHLGVWREHRRSGCRFPNGKELCTNMEEHRTSTRIGAAYRGTKRGSSGHGNEVRKIIRTEISNQTRKETMNNSSKFALGSAIGIAIGTAIGYLLNRDNRRQLVDNVRGVADKTRDSVVEGYYEAKEKYYELRDKLKREGADFVDEAEEFVEEKAKDGKKATEELMDKAANKLKDAADKK